MSYKSRWDNGGWNAICDACGRKFKANDLRLRWDGFMVCDGDWEPRHPQDFVKGVADIQAPKYARPESTDVFVPVNYTSYPDDQIDISETTKFNFTKYVRDAVPTTTSALNGAPLNKYVLDYTDPVASGATETVLINETFKTILGRNLSDSLTSTEAIAKVITKRFSDTIPIGESLQLIEVERTVESLSFAESVTRNISKVLAETITPAESVAKVVTKPISNEPISVSESVKFTPTKVFTDSIGATESVAKIIAHGVSESVSVAETVSTLLLSSTALNGSALNTKSLG